jgi:hypothetical protein
MDAEIKQWDGVCKCGHAHSSHGKIKSHNYTAGKCILCDCKGFVHDATIIKNTPNEGEE